tara:strand:- start:9235 stop:9492 length:258 start_codon:yes stop_codon:yes gene_type:complete
MSMTDNTDMSKYYTAQYMEQQANIDKGVLMHKNSEHGKIVDKIIFLMDEIAIQKSRIMPEDTGHLYTTISVLEARVQELRSSIDE